MSSMSGIGGIRNTAGGIGSPRGAAGGNVRGRAAGDKFGSQVQGPEGYNVRAFQQFTPEGLDLLQSLFSHAEPGGYLSKLASGDQSAFGDIEAPMWQDFESALGLGAQRFMNPSHQARQSLKGSGGFQRGLGQASSDFAMKLASNRQNLQRQALQDLFGISESLFKQKPFQYEYTEKPDRQSFIQRLLQRGLPIAGAAAGGAFGGPAGAQLGMNVGNAAGSLFA